MAQSAGIKRLVEQARSDPRFFHELVFNTDKAIAKATYLDEKSKATLRRLNADHLLRNHLPDIAAECGDTCGAGSCSSTCGAGSCLDTCKSSCGSTCGARSCDHTSGFGEVFEDTDPLRTGGIVAKVSKVKTVAQAAKTATAKTQAKAAAAKRQR